MRTTRLLLTPREAAEELQVSEKTLYNNTAPRGPIKPVRIGKRSIRYSLAALERWIEQQSNPECPA